MQHLMQQRDSAQQAAKTAAERQTAGSDAQQVSARDAVHALSSYHTAADAFGKHRTSCRSRQLTHIE